jgi:hypothetical protein
MTFATELAFRGAILTFQYTRRSYWGILALIQIKVSMAKTFLVVICTNGDEILM